MTTATPKQLDIRTVIILAMITAVSMFMLGMNYRLTSVTNPKTENVSFTQPTQGPPATQPAPGTTLPKGS